MAGARIKDVIGNQTTFYPDLLLLVDKTDGDDLGIGAADWIQARSIELSLLGNTYYQGSTNNINWHDEVTSLDTYIRFTTDGGVTWIPLTTDKVVEGTNLYFTEARVLATTGVQDAVDNSHTHTNKTLLDNIIDSGDGLSFLSNDGTYGNIGIVPIVTKVNNYLATASDNVILIDGTSNTVTVTLPPAAGNTGKKFNIKCIFLR